MIPSKRIILTGLLFLGLLHTVIAQTHSVKGKIVDAANNAPLSYANVFIDRTTQGVAADGDGYFELKGLSPGRVEILFSFVGYKLGKMTIDVNGITDIGLIKLEAVEQQLSEIEVKASRDKAWEKQLRRFEKIFLGDDQMAEGCKILNPWVLDFGKDKGKSLTATAEMPLQIENNALGYQLEFYLTDFWKNPQGYLIEGKVRFEQMPQADEETARKWLQNRQKAYVGSAQHFFKSIITKQIGKEKFYLYTERPGSGVVATRSLYFAEALEKDLMRYDTTAMVSPGERPGEYRINIKGRLEVHNHNERAIPRVYRDMGYQVSWVQVNGRGILVNSEGIPMNPKELIVSGNMADQRVSYMLPADYKTDHTEEKDIDLPSLAGFAEKLYLHTDKPYYYPGEPLWFKTYISYGDPIRMDSLSKVAYVEIIDAAGNIINAKVLLIEHGSAHGNFVLTNSLLPGTYYLRAYTSWSRNFKDGVFVKPFAVVNITEKVSPLRDEPKIPESTNITISTDKESYRTREKVNITLKTFNSEGDPVPARLSVSITDANQVVPMENNLYFLTKFNEPDHEQNIKIDNPLEYGITFRGIFQDERKRPRAMLFDIFQTNPLQYFLSQSDSMGILQLDGLNFYDSTELVFKTTGAKANTNGTVTILPRSTPPVRLDQYDQIEMNTIETGNVQRVISKYEVPAEAILLENVEILGRRIDEESFERYVASYGRPDYVLESKYINTSYGNLLFTLNGQMPGLVVRETNDPEEGFKWVVYTERARGSSVLFPPPPLITINNVAISGDAADILAAINPHTVDRIELTTRINSLQGTRGVGGVLAIYTKVGADAEESISKKDFMNVTVKGFDRPRKFIAPDHSAQAEQEVDLRSTIYWNPELETGHEDGTASFSFYCADLETTYNVMVLGVLEDNTTFAAQYEIIIRN